jgi:hypothetical protein
VCATLISARTRYLTLLNSHVILLVQPLLVFRPRALKCL